MKKTKYFFVVLISLCFLNCNNDDDHNSQSSNNPENPQNPEENLSENVIVYQPELLSDNLIFSMGQDQAYLLNKEGEIVNTWDLGYVLGNDIKILENSNLLGMFKAISPDFSFGGYGGIVRMFNFEGSEIWNFEYANENHLAHHDVLYLDNGNIMFQAWERLTVADAIQLGINTTTDIFPESLIEVNPMTNQIVWEWHSKDHLIQDIFPDIESTYGTISENPQLINSNFNLGDGSDITAEGGNIMHCNGIFYDSNKDIVYLSIYQYSEVWVIDHSTTTSEAASHSGGNYDKGGDLIYRFGNPMAYENIGERLFYRTHTPNIIKQGYPGAGNFLVYMNGYDESLGSKIYEFSMPETFELLSNHNNEPQILWEFEDEDLFFGRISGAQRLSNGNTLICEGDYGFWEVTMEKEIAWKYEDIGSHWRAYGYDLNDPALSPLDMN